MKGFEEQVQAHLYLGHRNKLAHFFEDEPHLLSCEIGESRCALSLVWPMLRISKALSAEPFQ
jgi:hypothetical protein